MLQRRGDLNALGRLAQKTFTPAGGETDPTAASGVPTTAICAADRAPDDLVAAAGEPARPARSPRWALNPCSRSDGSGVGTVRLEEINRRSALDAVTACWAMESRENDCRRGSGLCPISQSDQRSKRSEAGARSRGLPSPEARAQASARGARSVAALVDAPSVAPDESSC